VAVDVLAEIEIKRPCDQVSAFVADPANAPAWYKNIKAIEWQTPPPAVVGSRIRFRAQFSAGRWTTRTKFGSYSPGVAS